MGVRSGSAVSGVVGWCGAPLGHFLARGMWAMPPCGGTHRQTGNMCGQPSQLFLRHPIDIRKLNDVHRNLLEWRLVSVHIGQRWESNMPVCRSEQGTNEMGKEW